MLSVTFYENALSRFLQVCCITNPIWVIKTRLQLQRGPGPAVSPRLRQSVTHLRGNAGPYRGFVHAVKQIAKEEGVQGFYKGLLPSLLLVHPTASCTLVNCMQLAYLEGYPVTPAFSSYVCVRPSAMPCQHTDLVRHVVWALQCNDVYCMLPWTASPSVPTS